MFPVGPWFLIFNGSPRGHRTLESIHTTTQAPARCGKERGMTPANRVLPKGLLIYLHFAHALEPHVTQKPPCATKSLLQASPALVLRTFCRQARTAAFTPRDTSWSPGDGPRGHGDKNPMLVASAPTSGRCHAARPCAKARHARRRGGSSGLLRCIAGCKLYNPQARQKTVHRLYTVAYRRAAPCLRAVRSRSGRITRQAAS